MSRASVSLLIKKHWDVGFNKWLNNGETSLGWRIKVQILKSFFIFIKEMYSKVDTFENIEKQTL